MTAPALAGLSHVGLSVVDLDAASDFWSRVMGFEVTTRLPSLCFLVHRTTRLAIGLTDHDRKVDVAFNERRTGLDHLAIAVPDLEVLTAWAEHFESLGVDSSGIVQTDAGHHLNVRGPDNFPIELFVISASAVEGFGLLSAEEALARVVS